jgi:hypothetical protein
MRCGECGTENREGAKFSKDCAARMPTTCSNCGATIHVGSKFCDECGVSVPGSRLKSKVQNEPMLPARVLPEEALTNRALASSD